MTMTALTAATRFAEAIKDRPHVRVIAAPAINGAHVAWGPGPDRDAVTFIDGVTEADLGRVMAKA
jgi:hypothetical protein